MTWLEWLQTVSAPLCFSAATTGISSDSQLIAVAYYTENGPGLLMKATQEEDLLPAFEYHGIDVSTNCRLGVQEEEFKEQLASLFSRHTGLTYNVKFQFQQLAQLLEDPSMYDLCVLVKAAESRMIVPEHATNSLDTMFRFLVQEGHFGRVPFKQMLEHRSLSAMPPAGVLPVEHNAECLWRLMQTLASYELIQ